MNKLLDVIIVIFSLFIFILCCIQNPIFNREKYILVLDQGTASSRVIKLNKKAKAV